MSEDDLKSNFGRLDVSIPESTYEAGKVSTVSILIRNPFNEPVEIISLQGPKSSHLQEIEKSRQAVDINSQNEAVESPSFWSNFKKGFKQSLANVSFTEISLGGIQLEFPKEEKVLNIHAEENATIEIEHETDSFGAVNIHAEKSSNVKLNPSIEQKQQKHDILVIAPHCEVVAYFNVSTTGWLFFTPTRQTLNTQIEYKVGGKVKTQVVSSGFDIKPPLKSMIIGSIFGGGLGTLARSFNMTVLPTWQPLLVSIGASIVMSLIATIALSRKTGSQGFITVEDFFGGFVVGALIGYGGPEYFEKALIPEQIE